MKKNLMTVLILALLVVNLVLTALTMITIMPSAKQANLLITEICAALDLELESGRTANVSSVPVGDIRTYEIPDTLTINLTDSEDGSQHYAIVKVLISMNSKNEDFETYGAGDLSANEGLIKSMCNNVICKYTVEQFKNNPEDAQKQILEKIQGLYNSDFVIDVGFSEVTSN